MKKILNLREANRTVLLHSLLSFFPCTSLSGEEVPFSACLGAQEHGAWCTDPRGGLRPGNGQPTSASSKLKTN